MGMMQAIRSHAKGWLAWIVLIVIGIPFALFGINRYFSGTSTVAVATVDGVEVSLQEFQQAYQRQRMQMQSLLGSKFDINQLDEGELKNQTVQRLIDNQLLVEAAAEQGLRIPDDLLAQQINQFQAFRNDGKFSAERYEQLLRQRGYTPQSFERDFRRSLLAGQLLSGIAGSAFVPPGDVDRLIRLQQQKRSFGRLAIPVSRFSETKISDEAVQEYYDDHQDEFVVPEQVKAAYLELSREVVAKGITPQEEELRSYFDAHRANYSVPEQRRASHIFIELDKDAGDEEVAAAREKLEELRKKLQEGASFEELARKYSEDPGSAERGGDLGFFGRGVMSKGVEDAAFSLDVGEVSEPVRSEFGMHLVKLTDIRPGKTLDFDEARDQVLRDYRRERAETLYYEQAERLANLTFEHPHTLEVAAEALGLEVQETGFFPRGGAAEGAGIASNAKVAEAAFSPDVLEGGNNSAPVELEGGRSVVLRVSEHRPAARQSLEEARAEIVSRLREQAARRQAEQLGGRILKRLREGADAGAVAGELELQWERSEGVSRDEQSLAPEVLEAAFRMPAPPAGGASYQGVALPDGDFVVIALHAVEEGDPAEVTQARREELRQRLARAYGQSAFDAYLEALRERAEIVVHRENL